MSIFPTKLLVATEGSEEATLAAQTAADLGNKTGSELHIVYARSMPMVRSYSAAEPLATSAVNEEEVRERAQRFLDDQVERIKAEGGPVAQAHLRWGRPAREIAHLAEEIGAGLIVMGSRGSGGMRRALMGSVSDSVVRHAHCPVLIVRREA